MSLLITNIGELTTNDEQGRLRDAAVIVEGERISWVGRASAAPAADTIFDANGCAVLPGWVDSHTHMIFGGDRTAEFEARMAGQQYAAGGINVTVSATREATDQQLEENLLRLVSEGLRSGTTTFETKTGYGLTSKDELRSAKIARNHIERLTFLGAHVVPAGQDRESYLDLITGPLLDEISDYIDYVDVFCEDGAFDRDESARVLEAARSRGIGTRVHGNQLGFGPGVELAVEYGAASVDHLGFITEEDILLLADSWRGDSSGTVATILPACDLSTRMPLAPARKLMDAGAVLAIATNCNPGTSYTTSMGFAVATAVLQMHLSVEEAVRAATLGGAIALGMDRDEGGVGFIRPGALANLQLLDAPSITHIAYRPGVHLTRAVWKNGVQLV